MAIPEKVDRYEIQGEIDRGGMATVFRAHDPRFQRTVAVKLLPRQMMHDPQFKDRFTREAQTIAQLEHPAIVPVYDFGEDEGQPYLVMRLMEGGSLQHRLQNGPLSIEESAVILQRLGAALDAAHSRGIIHRDLKPSNVLFDQYGESYLADFGIAHVSSSEQNLTESGSIVGTPTYMSPEQVYGDKTIDGRSDIYALGVILFQMLTGRTPYDGDTPAKVMMKHVMDPVPTITPERPDLPQEMDAIITKAMAKERDERYATAHDLSNDISHATQKTTRPDLAADLAALKSDLNETEPTPPPSEPQPTQREDVIGIGTATTDYYQNQTSSGGVPVWIWAVLGVLALICIGGTIGAAYFISTLDTDELFADLTPEATATVSETEAELEREDELSTRVALLEATATAVPDTPTPRPTLTDEVEATSDTVALTRESAAATRAAEAEEEEDEEPPSDAVTIPNPFDNPTLKADFGPEEGELTHEEDNVIELIYADNALQDFVVSAIIGNPFSVEKGGWDFGLIFRQEEVDDEMRLVVRSNGEWNLNNRIPGEDSFSQDGFLDDLLELDEDEGNQITLIVVDDVGHFILNEEYIAQLDLSERSPAAGNIALGTGFYSSSEQEGSATSYEDFAVWELETEFGPESGELEHILDDLIKLSKADVKLSNFIVHTTFTNPFSSEESDFDFGYGFRVDDDQYWLTIESTEEWTLTSRFDSDAETDEVVASGDVDNLNTDDDEQNELTLIALGDIGYLLLNGDLVDSFDLSDITVAGDVEVVTAFYFDHEIEGRATGYEDFTIWQLP